MNTSANYHGIVDVNVKRDRIRGQAGHRDHDVVEVAARADDGSVITVAFFTAPDAVPRVAEAE